MVGTLQEHELSPELTDARLEEMRKIISSESFAKAPRLCSFLAYIVERSVAGDIDSLTEQQIGIHVFNRAPGYNSNDDNIVRGTARSLRQRLATYYLTEGLHDSVRIEIPKGAYVALFKDPDPLSVGRVDVSDHADPLPKAAKRVGWKIWAIAAVCVLSGLVAWPFVHARILRSQDKSTLLWNTLFTKDKTTFIVPGDAGLNMFEGLEKRSVDLNSYSQQIYQSNLASPKSVGEDVGSRFYTTMSDLALVAKLVRLPEANPERVQICFARDLGAHDIKDANLILIGTSSYNPWTELFQSSPSMKISWDVNQDMFTVENRTPQPGEQAEYQWTLKNGTKGGLTLISLTDNTQGNGRVLLIQGTTMGGVYAGSDFLSNKQLLDPILSKAQRPDGTVRNFEVLLQSDFIREGESNLHVLAVHVH
jgi:hypothetical protein